MKRLLLSAALTFAVCVMSACPPTPAASANQKHYAAIAWQGTCTVAVPCQVWRSTNGVDFSPVATLTANTFQDNNVTPNKTYWYYVTNSLGRSNTASATIKP